MDNQLTNVTVSFSADEFRQLCNLQDFFKHKTLEETIKNSLVARKVFALERFTGIDLSSVIDPKDHPRAFAALCNSVISCTDEVIERIDVVIKASKRSHEIREGELSCLTAMLDQPKKSIPQKILPTDPSSSTAT